VIKKGVLMRTRITELLGIEYPIIQGGMAWVAEYHLAAAVSEAGGLGIIGAASAPPEWVRDQIQKAKKMTDKPFGVNIMLMSPYADEIAKVIVEEKVKVVTTGAGSPEKYMQMWKEADVKVIPVVASVALAKRMERCHADAVVAEGTEAGGHIGINNDSCTASCRCGKDSCHCGRRNCRRKRDCGCIYARSKRSSDGNGIYRNRGMSGS
jgi:enoyl-[acyl-carrier protein] reductase II